MKKRRGRGNNEWASIIISEMILSLWNTLPMLSSSSLNCPGETIDEREEITIKECACVYRDFLFNETIVEIAFRIKNRLTEPTVNRKSMKIPLDQSYLMVDPLF